MSASSHICIVLLLLGATMLYVVRTKPTSSYTSDSPLVLALNSISDSVYLQQGDKAYYSIAMPSNLVAASQFLILTLYPSEGTTFTKDIYISSVPALAYYAYP